MSLTTPHNDIPVSASAEKHWPRTFGKVKDEFAALRSTCGVYELPERVHIRLTGSDRVRWLNGMITNNIRDLAQDHGVYSFLLNPQGHILGDLVAFHRGDALLATTDRSQLEKMLATFEHYIIMDDVEVADISDSVATMGLAGPKSSAVVAAAGIERWPTQALEVADQSWRNVPISIVRGESESFPSFEFWIAPEHVAKLREALQTAGATLVGQEALELHRVAMGSPIYGKDIRERDLPQETEQERALNFNKGCYVGQEIVERIRSRGNVHRKFTGFRTVVAPPAIGTRIQSQGKDVGEITSTAVIPGPAGDQAIALGYVRRELSAPGKELEAAGTPITVAELPFRDLLTP
jgi:folate-binding protein YgfZ